jgi:hypothetical protein
MTVFEQLSQRSAKRLGKGQVTSNLDFPNEILSMSSGIRGGARCLGQPCEQKIRPARSYFGISSLWGPVTSWANHLYSQKRLKPRAFGGSENPEQRLGIEFVSRNGRGQKNRQFCWSVSSPSFSPLCCPILFLQTKP